MREQSDWQHPQWLIRPPTDDEQRWIWEWMTRDLRESTKRDLLNVGSGSHVELLHQWKVIDDMLRAAGYEAHPGGGPEDDDLVRDVLARAARADKIVEMHHKQVDAHGGTTGDCNECGWSWPCPTYEWARADSDRDPYGGQSAWDRNDDGGRAAAGGGS